MDLKLYVLFFENCALLFGEEYFFVTVLDFDQKKEEEKIKYLLHCVGIFFSIWKRRREKNNILLKDVQEIQDKTLLLSACFE